MKIGKVFLPPLIIFIALLCPSNAGNFDVRDFGDIQPLSGGNSYGDYIEIVGDGHMHSVYSGGPSTVHEFAQKAQERNLNCIFITDYNTIAAKQNCLEETTPIFLCGLGEQVATGTNDIIAWGIDYVVDWHTDENYTVGDILDEIHAQGGLAYLPHPCHTEEDDNYDYFGVYDDFDGIAIYHGYAGFNAAFPTTMDVDALNKWDEYLNDGMRKTGLGESDCKNADNTPDGGSLSNRRGAIGYPRNYIYAKEFSIRGIIEAVRHGRCYVTDGPTMNFTIDSHIMGDTIYAESSMLLNIEITGNAIENSYVRIISNGAVVHSESVSSGPFSVSYPHTADTDAYFRVELRTYNGWLLKGETNIAFSNPIYFDLSPYEEKPSPPTNLEAWVGGSDIVLNWTSSISSDVMHYNIYRSTTLDGFDFTYPYALTSKTTWTDVGAGEGDTSNYYYIVKAVDEKLYNDTNMVKVGKYALPLNKGWNMVSTPLAMSKTAPDDVLQTVNDTCEIARYYDAFDGSDHWKDTKAGDLLQINNTMALWLYLNASDHLITSGRNPTSTQIALHTGWNFVGYPSLTNRSLDDTMSGVSWETIWSFNLDDPTGDYWEGNDTARLNHMDDLDGMRTGRGYWILVTEDCIWTVSS